MKAIPKASVCFIHCSIKQAIVLESVFAYLTEDGWVVPEWVRRFKQQTVRGALNRMTRYSLDAIPFWRTAP